MSDIIITALATYGIASLFSKYDGPFNILLKLRSKFAVFRCAVCVGVWVAAVVAAVVGIDAIEYMAVVGIVIIVEEAWGL